MYCFCRVYVLDYDHFGDEDCLYLDELFWKKEGKSQLSSPQSHPFEYTHTELYPETALSSAISSHFISSSYSNLRFQASLSSLPTALRIKSDLLASAHKIMYFEATDISSISSCSNLILAHCFPSCWPFYSYLNTLSSQDSLHEEP